MTLYSQGDIHYQAYKLQNHLENCSNCLGEKEIAVIFMKFGVNSIDDRLVINLKIILRQGSYITITICNVFSYDDHILH